MKSFVICLLFITFFVFKTKAQSKPWVAPASASQLKNPIADKSNLSAGKALYTANCAPCHGDKGKGNGIAASALNPKPADHTSEKVQSESDGTLFWKISEGRSPMPGYKQTFTETQRWEIVNFMRSLKAK